LATTENLIQHNEDALKPSSMAYVVIDEKVLRNSGYKVTT